MGTAIGERLLAAGFPLAVYNRTVAKTAPLVEAGAVRADTPRELAASTDIVLTVLTDDAAVDTVYHDLLSGDVDGRLFVDASTIRAATIARLAGRVDEAGARLVDAPLAGPP